jgi:hypothetical protein
VLVRPVSLPVLVEELAERIAATVEPARQLLAGAPEDAWWVRVAIDGAPAADPDSLAAALVDPLRVRGRAALWVSTSGFLRPASLRLERGRTDPDAYYEGWWDLEGLRREVLDPLGPGGTGRVLPSLWNPETDRATRADYVNLPPGGVVLVSGPLLLGTGLAFDLTVHLAVSAPALVRRTPPDQHWTLPAYARYADEVAPSTFADVVVRLDDPRHPAVVGSA